MSKPQPQPCHTKSELIAEETVLKLLTESDPSAQSSVYQPLRQRLLQQQQLKEIKPMRSGRLALIIGCIMLALLTLTPVRSSLAAVLQQFGLIRITDEPTISQELQGQPLAAYELTPAPTKEFSHLDSSVKSIANQIGSHVYSFNDVPAGYMLNTRFLDVVAIGSFITTLYVNPDDVVNNSAATIYLIQIYQPQANAKPYDFAIGDATATSIQVRGVNGLWIEQAPLIVADDGTGHFTTVEANVLIWSEGANSFKLQSNRLDKTAMVALAESLE